METNLILHALRDRRIASEALDDLDYLRRLRAEQSRKRLEAEMRRTRPIISRNWLK